MTITLHTAKMDENVTPERETQDDVSHKVPDCDNSSEDSPIEASSEDQPKEDWIDVLGNGQLKKRVIRKGVKTGLKPQRGDMCTVKFVGVLDDSTVVEEYDDMLIQIGDLEVVQGLDLTLVLMELGEVAEVIVNPRFAYGTRGMGSVPSNATITYKVELKKIEYEPEIETLSVNQRREIGNKKRERGNWWFIRKDLSFAIQCYRRALHYLQINSGKWSENEETETVTDTELQALLDDCIKVYNNLAAVLIETEAYNSALENVDLVLKYQPKNTKALFRKGKILKIKGDYGKAYVTFLEAQKLEPEMKMVQVELMSLREKISKESEKEKHLYAKMLGINKDADKLSKNVKAENKSKIAKGILLTLLGASAAVVGILIHRFAS